jgi:glycerol-3-phosphate acyltransferase PlsY
MILSVVLGFIWYGPLFGKRWMTLSGITMPSEKPGMGTMIRPMVISFIGAIFMSFVLTYLIAFHNGFYQTSGYMTAILMGIFAWIGFIVPVYLNFLGWEGRPKELFFINTGYWLVFIILSSPIINVFM